MKKAILSAIIFVKLINGSIKDDIIDINVL